MTITDKDQIIRLLADTPAEKVYRMADEVRHNQVGDEVHLRGLIEFSNICRNDCMYCGLRGSNHTVKRYHMSEDEVIGIARRAASIGFMTIVLQSGEDLYYSQERLCRIIKAQCGSYTEHWRAHNR